MAVLSTIKDAESVGETVVIIDVFRSSNTIIELLHKGVGQIVPVESIAAAKQLKTGCPNWTALGERDGIMVDGFEGDNSPTRIGDDLSGKSVILTTSGGTRCIAACSDRPNVIIASFANADAVITHLQREGIEDPSFWAVGQKALHPATEDELCASYLNERYKGNEISFGPIQTQLIKCIGAKRLRDLGQDDDLDYCTLLNSRSVVPVAIGLNNGLLGIVNAARIGS